jgi:hypothetical protein
MSILFDFNPFFLLFFLLVDAGAGAASTLALRLFFLSFDLSE